VDDLTGAKGLIASAGRYGGTYAQVSSIEVLEIIGAGFFHSSFVRRHRQMFPW